MFSQRIAARQLHRDVCKMLRQGILTRAYSVKRDSFVVFSEWRGNTMVSPRSQWIVWTLLPKYQRALDGLTYGDSVTVNVLGEAITLQVLEIYTLNK